MVQNGVSVACCPALEGVPIGLEQGGLQVVSRLQAMTCQETATGCQARAAMCLMHSEAARTQSWNQAVHRQVGQASGQHVHPGLLLTISGITYAWNCSSVLNGSTTLR